MMIIRMVEENKKLRLDPWDEEREKERAIDSWKTSAIRKPHILHCRRPLRHPCRRNMDCRQSSGTIERPSRN